MLYAKKLRRELDQLITTFDMITDPNKTIEYNYLANAIMVLEYRLDLGLSEEEAQIKALAEYQRWARYLAICLSVGFDRARVPLVQDFEAAHG